jgi:hypothetical protein
VAIQILEALVIHKAVVLGRMRGAASSGEGRDGSGQWQGCLALPVKKR